MAEAAEHNRIQLGNSGYGTFNSRGPIVLTDEHASDAPGLQGRLGSGERAASYFQGPSRYFLDVMRMRSSFVDSAAVSCPVSLRDVTFHTMIMSLLVLCRCSSKRRN